MTALAFDLTEQLQTPVIIMTDLDLGMNDHVTEALTWDESRHWNRGKVLTAEQLDKIYDALTNGDASATHDREAITNGGKSETQSNIEIEMEPGPEAENAGQFLEQFRGKFGRYLDIDDDGVPYRTIPGTHSTRGAYVTRGSSRDEYAVYTEDADTYRRNVDRLARKWDTAKELVPGPVLYGDTETGRRGDAAKGGRGDAGTDETQNPKSKIQNKKDAVIFFGTSIFAAEEAIEMLADEGIHLDAMRVRAFPFGKAFREFVDSHERIFLIEQNRDAQFRSLMMIELGVDPAKIVSILNYDGMPITADNIYRQIKQSSK